MSSILRFPRRDVANRAAPSIRSIAPAASAASLAQAGRSGTPTLAQAAPVLDVVIPVYNEQRDLERSVRRLREHLDTRLRLPAVITIADNASTDLTWPIARRLAAELAGVRALHLDQKGRGRALKRAWCESDAAIVAYMDVDLSTDLACLEPLIAPLLSGDGQLAIGSRLAPGARVRRGPKRELISRSYNLILRTALRLRVRDAQCGFKAMRADVARELLPYVEDDAWFLDTELLVLAQRAGLATHELPVGWTDDPDSRVNIVATAMADLRGVARLLRHPVRVELDRRAFSEPIPVRPKPQLTTVSALGGIDE